MPRALAAFPKIAVALLMLALNGCAGSFWPSHIHDAERAALTAKLVTTLDAHDQNAPSAYETMLKSTRAIAAAQDKVLAELANNRAAARDQLLPFKTFKVLAADAERVRQRLGALDAALRDSAKEYLKEQKIAAADAKIATEAIEKANEAVAQAKADVTNWNASIALLQAAISQFPAVATAKSDDRAQSDLDHLAARLREIGGKQVDFVDADGKTQRLAIKDILKIQDVTKERSLSVSDAPGATLTILMLGVDLAKIQRQRAETRLAQLSRRLALYERLLSEVMLARALLTEVSFDGNDTAVFEQDAVRLVYDARRERRGVSKALEANDMQGVTSALQKSDRAMLALSNKLVMLRLLAVADSITTRSELALQRDSKRLDHEESLLNAQVNDLEWRTMLRSGVAVLNQYEQGGFTREDAANIIRIAQTLALGVIAGRVD